MTLMTKRHSGTNNNRKRVIKWLNSFDKASAAVEKHGDLLKLLAAGQGLCKIENFLPDYVAQGLFEILEDMQDEEWNVSISTIITHNNTLRMIEDSLSITERCSTMCSCCTRICCCMLQVTAADDDYTHNNISHDFLSSKSQTLESIFRVFTLLLPDSLFTFSAAKYCKEGHIKPHDDRAFTKVRDSRFKHTATGKGDV